MEAMIVPISEIHQKGVWHFQPYSQAVREVTVQLEHSPFPVIELGKLVIDAKRGFPKRGTDDYEGIPLITVRNLTRYGVDLTESSYITPEEHQKLQQTEVQQKDVLTSLVARPTIAAVYQHDQPANISQYVLRLRLKSELDPAYLVYYLNSELGQTLIQCLVTGAVQQMLSINALMSLPVILPSLSEQKRIVEQIQQIEQQAVELSQQVQEQYSQAFTQFNQFIKGGKDEFRTLP